MVNTEIEFGKYGIGHHLVVVDINKEGMDMLKEQELAKEAEKLAKNISYQIESCVSQNGVVVFITEGNRPTIPSLKALAPQAKTFRKKGTDIVRENKNFAQYLSRAPGVSYSVVGLSACLCVPCVAENLQNFGNKARILVGCTLGYTSHDCTIDEVKRNNPGLEHFFFYPDGEDSGKISLIDYL